MKIESKTKIFLMIRSLDLDFCIMNQLIYSIFFRNNRHHPYYTDYIIKHFVLFNCLFFKATAKILKPYRQV